MSQAAILKQNSYTNSTNFIDVEKYVNLLLGFGEAHLEHLLAYLQRYNKSTGQLKSIDVFIRKMDRLVCTFNYKFRTVLDIDGLSIIVSYFEDVLYYVGEILFAAERKHEFEKDLKFCNEALQLFEKVVDRYSADSKRVIHFPTGNSNKSRGFEIGEMTLYLFYLLEVGSADMHNVKYAIERKGNDDPFVYEEGKEYRQAMEKLMGFISADEIKNNFLIQININFKSMLNQAAQPYSTNDLSTITNILHWSKQLLSLLKDVHKDKLRKCEKRKEPEKKKQPEQEQKLETATAQDIKNSVRTVTMENSSKDLIETLRGKHEQLQSELNRERKKNCDLHEANRIAEKEASQARKIIEEKQDEIVSLRKENEDCRNRISSMMMSQEVGTTSSKNLLDINRLFRLLYVNEYKFL
ncbi:myosin-M heavy chain-like [Clytia hemisphaerica]|uniref:myosin-M heavy chain-like n=1 Tax=Clytia hemisphaerica TaxID=252671 RepID=UPI0034D5919F